MGVSKNRRAENRPKYTMILLIRTPKMGPIIFGSPQIINSTFGIEEDLRFCPAADKGSNSVHVAAAPARCQGSTARGATLDQHPNCDMNVNAHINK